MKKLEIVEQGGMPLFLDDFRFMQDGYVEAIKGLVSPYLDAADPSDFVILSGMLLDGGVVSPGYVFINGEVCYCSGFNGQPSPYLKLAVEDEYDPAGSKMFLDNANNPIDTYKITKVVLYQYGDVNAPGNSTDFIPQASNAYDMNYLQSRINAQVIASHPVPLTVNTQVIPEFEVFEGVHKVEGMMGWDGVIRLRGRYIVEDMGNGGELFLLPVPYGLLLGSQPERFVVTSVRSALTGGETRPVVLKFANAGNRIKVSLHEWLDNPFYIGVVSLDGIQIPVW